MRTISIAAAALLLALATFTPLSAQHSAHALQAFSAAELRAAAANLVFRPESSMPIEASDALEYFDVASEPVMKKDSPILLGKMRVKVQSVRIKGVHQVLPPGDYYDWVGRKAGAWVRGYSTSEGRTIVITPANFGEPPTESHRSAFHVFVHDVGQLDELRSGFAVATAPPGQVPKPLPPPPKPQPPPPKPEPPRKPEPPASKPPRCVLKCKTLLDLDQTPPRQYWLPDWVEVS